MPWLAATAKKWRQGATPAWRYLTRPSRTTARTWKRLNSFLPRFTSPAYFQFCVYRLTTFHAAPLVLHKLTALLLSGGQCCFQLLLALRSSATFGALLLSLHTLARAGADYPSSLARQPVHSPLVLLCCYMKVTGLEPAIASAFGLWRPYRHRVYQLRHTFTCCSAATTLYLPGSSLACVPRLTPLGCAICFC